MVALWSPGTTSSSPWRRSPWVSRGVAFRFGGATSGPGEAGLQYALAAGSPCRAGLRRRRQPAGVRGRRRHGTEGPRSPYPPRPRRSHLRRRRASRTPGRRNPEFSRQRGYVVRPARGPRHPSTAGRTPHHGPDPRNAPSPRWRRWAAAAPRASPPPSRPRPRSLVFQGIWAAGRRDRDDGRVVGDEGLESCAVRWQDGGRSEARGGLLPTVPPRRARQWRCGRSRGPSTRARWTGRARTRTHRRPGRAGRSPGAITAGIAVTRVRRQPIRLAPAPRPIVHVSEQTPVHVDAGDPLPALLRALSALEAWEDEPAPRRRTVRAGRAGPVLVPVVAGGGHGRPAFLVELPDPVGSCSWSPRSQPLLWAVYGSLSTWLAVSPAYRGPVTSEWEYQLVRTPTDEWAALLLLGDRAPLARLAHG